ncbi:putative integral membrane protein [Kribbella sp. VKM Ac-2569]|uniref:LapA family protein n=1 Tax=Kribbella sp. VKM Ac-2569 TaxID=2512220 RepID=UPI00102C3713|nr:lipopolysaccharide assembly protein LapA domain-containing protein [Kribbella sp. VKM Ac-2569]RZT16894.1 putative integral membrane protein [Kribbella sp. VKM Ac-2569]
MSVLHRTRKSQKTLADPPLESVPTPATSTEPAAPDAVPRTRTGATWVGVCAAALTLVVLIVFMLQNTRRVEVSFLWMNGSVPLALALLIAGVGVGIVAMVIGTARVTQLRRLVHHRQRRH